MSNLTVKGNTSGTGTVTLEAPNTNSNRTITLPDATATLATTADLSTINTALEFISSATINNVATVDFTGFDSSKYSDYVFTLDNVIPVTDGMPFGYLLSSDGGSSFEASYYVYVLEGAVAGLQGTYSTGFIATAVGSDVGEFGVSGVVKVFGPDLVAKTRVSYSGAFVNLNAAFIPFVGGSENATTAAINAIRFKFSSGNLESGRITMYGVRKS